MFDHDKIPADVFNASAELYQQKYMDVEMYEEALRLFYESLPLGAAILDIGCGPGNFARYLCAKDRAFKITGVDGSPVMVRLATTNVPGADFIVADCRNLDFIQETYGGVLCSFLIPYLTEPEVEKLVQLIGAFLPKGNLYLSFITSEENKSEVVTTSTGEQLGMNYYADDYIHKLLASSGFNLVFSQHYQSPNTAQRNEDSVIVAWK